MKEEAVLFGASRSLVGVITTPAGAARAADHPAAILLNSGLVHRVGPNRIYVKLARQLAAAGMTVLRFDYSGVGDSPARSDGGLLDECRVEETLAATQLLSARQGIQRFVLMGICSGAVNSFNAIRQDPRIIGAALINPLGYSSEFATSAQALQANHLARTYWKTGLLNPKSWLRVIGGRANYGMLTAHLKNLAIRHSKAAAAGSSVAREYQQIIAGGAELLVVYSGQDRRWEQRHRMVFGDFNPNRAEANGLVIKVLEDANHTFTSIRCQQELIQLIQDWVRQRVWGEVAVPVDAKPGPALDLVGRQD